MKQIGYSLQEDTAGDPMGRGRLWTGKRLVQITQELRRLRIAVSPNTVRRLLDRLGYALHANRPAISLHCPAQEAFRAALSAYHQRGQQEEGINWQLQKPGASVEPGTSCGQRS